MTRPDVTSLLLRCRAGDPQAAEELARAYRPMLFRLALSVLDDLQEADDAAQEALVAALKKLDTYRGEADFKTWLFAIAVNNCRGRLRRRRSRERALKLLAGSGLEGETRQPSPEELMLRGERQEALLAAVNALEVELRLPLVLRYYHNLRITEIAAILQVSARTVHNRLHAQLERDEH